MTLEEYELYELTKPSFIQNVNFSMEAKHRDPIEPLVQGRNGIPHEEDTPVEEPAIVCTFEKNDDNTFIFYRYQSSGYLEPISIEDAILKMEIDGIEQEELVTEYNFETEGEHIVKYWLIDPTEIRHYFCLLNDLKSVVIPSSVTEIAEDAFKGSGLTSVIIPANVTSLGQEAFFECSHLTNITSLATTAPELNSDSLPHNANGTLTVPAGSTGYDEWIEELGEGWTLVEQ